MSVFGLVDKEKKVLKEVGKGRIVFGVFEEKETQEREIIKREYVSVMYVCRLEVCNKLREFQDKPVTLFLQTFSTLISPSLLFQSSTSTNTQLEVFKRATGGSDGSLQDYCPWPCLCLDWVEHLECVYSVLYYPWVYYF